MDFVFYDIYISECKWDFTNVVNVIPALQGIVVTVRNLNIGHNTLPPCIEPHILSLLSQIEED